MAECRLHSNPTEHYTASYFKGDKISYVSAYLSFEIDARFLRLTPQISDPIVEGEAPKRVVIPVLYGAVPYITSSNFQPFLTPPPPLVIKRHQAPTPPPPPIG